jgi:transcription elongation factor Elf1
MRCPRCGSTQVAIQAVTETTFKTKRKSLFYWLTIGWLIEPLLWIFLTLPKLFFELFKPHRFTAKTTTKKLAICQNCGKSWRV